MWDEILQIALRQLKEGGYSHLNFQKIADELGTTRANIHYHFNSKENLAKECLKYFLETNKEIIESIFEKNNHNFQTSIEEIEETLLEMHIENSGKGICACSPIITESEEVPNQLIDTTISYFKIFSELFKEEIIIAQQRGLIDNNRDPEILANEALYLFMGFVNLSKTIVLNNNNKFIQKGILKNWAKSLLPA